MQPVVTLSVDAMGGDHAPGCIIAGIAKAVKEDGALRFILHGNESRIQPLVEKRDLGELIAIRHTDEFIEMSDKPSQAVRRGRNSSMWHTLQSVKNGEAGAAVSAGNTGALMALALFSLGKAKGVNRPAIAALWPSSSEAGRCVMLDLGADIRADAADLVAYAMMGAEYARVAVGVEKPRVGVLNIGTESMKGRVEERDAAEILENLAKEPGAGFEYVGFVEANAILGDASDVVVTDGYSGNIALKSAEGTAAFISNEVYGAFSRTIRGRIAALMGMPSFRSLKKRIDPRRINGGVFLGLDGVVIKSHGSTDATGFAAAVQLAARMARSDFGNSLAAEMERSLHAVRGAQDGASDSVSSDTVRPVAGGSM